MILKKSQLAVVLIMLMLTPVFQIACAKAVFEVDSLEVTPNRVVPGEKVSVKVDLVNTGGADGIYDADLLVDGAVEETQYITLPAGTTQIAFFYITRQEVGTYRVQIGNLTETFNVVKPAEFQLSSLAITPGVRVLGEEIEVTVDVQNIGDLEGEYSCVLVIDGANVQKERVKLDGGATETVNFNYTPEKCGSCEVMVGDLTHTIKVMKPAEFQLQNLLIFPEEVAVNSSVKIMADLTNTGDLEGDYTVTLCCDGDTEDATTVTLEGGGNETVLFDMVPDTIGLFTITVNDLEGTVFSIPAAPAGFIGYADWENGFFIVYPEGWEQLDTSGAFLAAFMDPINVDAGPNFSVSKEVLQGYTTVKEYLEMTMEVCENIFHGFKTISTEEMEINGIKAARAISEWSSGQISARQQIVILLQGNTCYTIIFTTLSDAYEDYENAFDVIANSFVLLPK